jgi:hypothetical protein
MNSTADKDRKICDMLYIGVKKKTILVQLQITKMFLSEFRSFLYYDSDSQKVLEICRIPKATIRP